jgi:hypothetical protein
VDWFRSSTVRIAAFLLNNVPAQVSAAVLLGLGQFVVGQYFIGASKHPEIVLALQSIIWSMFALLLIVWFQNHTKHRARRTLELTKAMQVSDFIEATWLWDNRRLDERAAVEDLRSLITKLLGQLCGLLAYRVPYIDKGATFLVLLSDADNASFGLFAQIHHDDPSIPKEIRDHLRKDLGIAGQAVRDGSCIVIHDCKHPPKNIKWSPNKVPPRFAGRAAVRVRGTINDQLVDIGALCFDVKQPWTLSDEDQELAQAFADKIGSICALWIRVHTEKDGIQVLRNHALR